MGSSSYAELSRAWRGVLRHRGVRAATALVGTLCRIAWLLLVVAARWRRLRAALAALGAATAAHFAGQSPPMRLARALLARRVAERRMAATHPPWPAAGAGAAERALGLLRGALLRYGGPGLLARRRLRAADVVVGSRAIGLEGLPGPVLGLRSHAEVVAEALALTGDDLAASRRRARVAARLLAGDLAALTLAACRALGVAAVACARGLGAGALATGRALRTGGVHGGRALRVAAARTARVSWVVAVALAHWLAIVAVAGARAARFTAVGTGRGVRATVLGIGRGVRATGPPLARASAAVVRLLAVVVATLAAPPDRRLPAWRRFLRPVTVALLLTGMVGAAAGLPAAAVLGDSVKTAAAGLPSLAEMRPLAQPERSQVYDRNGRVIEVLHDEQDRIVVPLASVPKVLQQAVLAAEDERFYRHHGIDDRGILRALLANVLSHEPVQGGSTITQQLVRNTYPDLRDRSLLRKVKEASLAAQLEERLSKDQILEAYLNRVYFGSGYYGVEAASRGYFGKHVGQLTLSQAATLAGVIREPEISNPREEPQRALERRNTVLRQMAALSMTTPSAAARAVAAPLGVRPPSEVGGRYPWFIDALKTQLLQDPRLGRTVAERNRMIYEGGLRIDTTLDPDMQDKAERAVAAHRPPSGPDVGLVAIDPRDGAVRALVGGRDYRRRQFNLAVQGERQAGSSFKPFVLAAAMADGISPDSRWESSGFSASRVCGAPWTVANYEGKGSGKISLREATWRSVNGVYARVMAQVCPTRVVEMVKRLGAEVPASQAHAPSIALGSANVSPLEMASAYATLANLGVRNRPILYTKVSHHGSTVLENRPHPERRISAALAFQVTDVLKGVIQRGTGTAAKIAWPAAGKTGTTQDYRDAWFIGYTRQLATAVWMGYPGREVPMLDVGGIRVTGGSYPARIWHDFMASAMEGEPPLDWERPSERLHFTVGPPAGQQQVSAQRSRQRPRGRGRGRH
jgi:penicillin-binding protein 1A